MTEAMWGLVCAVGLLLDHGGNDDDIPDGVSLLLRRRPHLVVEPPVKVDQHLVDGGLGVLAQIKLVGVREEVALQSVRLPSGISLRKEKL